MGQPDANKRYSTVSGLISKEKRILHKQFLMKLLHRLKKMDKTIFSNKEVLWIDMFLFSFIPEAWPV